jgi:hypothetical protein
VHGCPFQTASEEKTPRRCYEQLHRGIEDERSTEANSRRSRKKLVILPNLSVNLFPVRSEAAR